MSIPGRHIICVTVDTDPDGLNRPDPDRASFSWESLSKIEAFTEALNRFSREQRRAVPVTWFIRVDRQLQELSGSEFFLLHEFRVFWDIRCRQGDELAWHPHLYERQPDGSYRILEDPEAACDELKRLWFRMVQEDFKPAAFRNGEGWMHPAIYDQVEAFGFAADSTAIPGIPKVPGHPRNWENALNQPYFPSRNDCSLAGNPRRLVEIPMTTWNFQASYDERPRIRYMNPAVRSVYYRQAVENWKKTIDRETRPLRVWVMILHPEEVVKTKKEDLLYSRCPEETCTNLRLFCRTIEDSGGSFEFQTISQAAFQWRKEEAKRAV